MRRHIAVAILVITAFSPSLTAADFLELKLPPAKFEGTLVDIAADLGKLGFRVCVEEVNLSSEPVVSGIHIESRGETLREFLDQLARDHPDIGWEGAHFVMCPVIHLFKKSSVHDSRNPLNVVLRQFSFRDADLISLSELVYYSSEQFRKTINPNGIAWAYAGSRISGASMTPSALRYSFFMDGWTLRELLDGLSCVSVNHGLSWYFWHDPKREFPDNFVMRKF
jgi:hypothetical protein